MNNLKTRFNYAFKKGKYDYLQEIIYAKPGIIKRLYQKDINLLCDYCLMNFKKNPRYLYNLVKFIDYVNYSRRVLIIAAISEFIGIAPNNISTLFDLVDAVDEANNISAARKLLIVIRSIRNSRLTLYFKSKMIYSKMQLIDELAKKDDRLNSINSASKNDDISYSFNSLASAIVKLDIFNFQETLKDYYKKLNKEKWDTLFRTTFYYILGNVEDNAVKGEYLASLVLVHKEFNGLTTSYDDLFAPVIQNVNLLEQFLIHYPSLDGLVSKQYQEELIDDAIKVGDNKRLKGLTISTNTQNTYKAIDYLVLNGDYETDIYLLSNLKGMYCIYAMNKIINCNVSEYIIRIINQLYMLESDAFIVFIKFIVEYGYMDLFTREEQDIINGYFAEKEDMLLALKKG